MAQQVVYLAPVGRAPRTTTPHFGRRAEACGAWGKTLTAPEQLKPAIEEAFKQEGPAIIGVPIDYDENMKLTKRLGELAFTI